MNDLQKFFYGNNKNVISKWSHYFDIYEQYFSKYRGKDICFVEIGVYQGGSLQMWKEYFGPKAKIYGIDINPACKQFEDDQITIIIGDQENKDFLKELKHIIPKIDILLDDGGHTMKQQKKTFEVLFDHIEESGIYLCEDTHTSYWKNFGGGYKNKDSFIEYSKNIIDYINAWHSNSRKLSINNITKTVKAIHFYDSIVLIEKNMNDRPVSESFGIEVIPNKEHSLGRRIYNYAKNKVYNAF